MVRNRSRVFALILVILLSGLSLTAQAAPGRSSGELHYCKAYDGVIVEQRGTATCWAGEGSYALAIGPQAYAGANTESKATATGVGSRATADNFSTAHAVGNLSLAQAVDRSVAEASGKRSSATAVTDGRATANGERSSATATNGGTATATGACTVVAHGVDAECTGR